MAVVKLASLILTDRTPGVPDPHLGIPTDGWDGTTHSEVTASPVYPLGTKIAAYSDATSQPGWYTMIYGGFASLCAAADISGEFSDGMQWCGHCDLTQDAADATYEIPVDCRDGSHTIAACFAKCYTDGANDISRGGPVVLPCATLAGYQYGWFWCGGVCPVDDVTLFRGSADSELGADMTTDGNIEPGKFFVCVTKHNAVLFHEISVALDVSVGLDMSPTGVCTMSDG